MIQEIAIQTNQLSRFYRNYSREEGLLASFKGFLKRKNFDKAALKPTDLTIYKGEIVGLVGSNGAGKTTLLKLLSGLIHPTQGTASVLGYSPWERDNRYLSKMSLLLGQKSQLWWDLPPLDSYGLLARIYSLDAKKAISRAKELADLLRCEPQLYVQLRRLSLGERMKMEIIGSLLHQPEVLFLDEPTIGLDIVAQTTIRQFISAYKKEFKPTIILTSHYMDDISLLADRLLLISKGSIVYDGQVSEFMGQAETKQKLLVKIDRPLATELNFEGQVLGLAKQEILEFDIKASSLGGALKTILDENKILDLKIEETDFEDVIREFLEKDVGTGKARHPRPI